MNRCMDRCRETRLLLPVIRPKDPATLLSVPPRTNVIWTDRSELKYCLVGVNIELPPAEPLPNDEIHMSYVFLANDTFGRKTNLMKPYLR